MKTTHRNQLDRFISSSSTMTKPRIAERKNTIMDAIAELQQELTIIEDIDHIDSVQATIEVLQEALAHLNHQREDRSGGLAAMGLL